MLRVALLLALAASAVAQPCKYPVDPSTGALTGGAGFWNGASSVANVMPALAAKYNSTHGSALVGGYLGQGSGTGVAGVNKCYFVLGFSDDPMTAADDSVWGSSKVTIPTILVTYNFFSSGNKGGKKVYITPKASAALFAKSAPSWSVVTANKGKLNNAFSASASVIRVGRLGKSGTNQVFRSFWNKAAGTNLPINGNQFGTNSGENLGLDKNYATATDVCKNVKATAGSITYSIVGICKKQGAIENFIQNKAKVYVNSNTWSSIGAIPRQPPACTASYATFNLFFNAGARTAPIASFIYAFARTTSNTPASSGFPGRSDTGKAASYNSEMAKALIKTLLLNFGTQLQKTFSYQPVPPNIASKANKCLASIKP
jgi:ABC-type phosphate transport system substrate-binding protein